MATAALTPEVLASIGRGLCVRGETVHVLEVAERVTLPQAGSWDVRGGYRPESWRYRVDLFGPDRTVTRTVAGASVLHCRYAVRPGRPHVGVGPLAGAPETAALAATIEAELKAEFAGPVGTVLFMPDSFTASSTELKTFKREVIDALRRDGVFMAAGGAEAAGLGVANQSPVSERVGPRPPAEVAQLREGIAFDVLAACGISRGLLAATAGNAAREAYRQFLHSCIQPVARQVAAECAAKLDVPGLRLRFRSLEAGDVTGRARAFRSLVEAGIDVGEARELAGLV